MSTLAETYALACGVRIDTPVIEESFFPLEWPLDKVVLIHAFAGAIGQNGQQLQATFPAKIYDHFNDVVTLLKPVLDPLGYRFYQIGGPNEPGLRGIESLCGRTSMLQCAYLVKRAALLVGNDSQWAHVRGTVGKKLVALYGPTSVKCHGPYWNDPTQTILIESHRAGKPTSYAAAEHPKTINWIPPEQVANAALSLLDVPPLSQQTIYVGSEYNMPAFELVPNVVIDPRIQMAGPLVVRMDYHFDESMLISNLRLRKCLIITDREINLNFLVQLKGNIVSVRIEIDKVSHDWLRQLRKLGIPTGFFTSERDEVKIRQMRLDFYDTCLFDLYHPPFREEFAKGAAIYLNKELDKDFNWTKLKIRTNKFLLSDNKIYLSKAHWQAGRPAVSTDANTDTIIDSPEFWEEQAHFLFYTE